MTPGGPAPDMAIASDPTKTEARLRQIIDLVPHMIFAKDVHGRFLLVNRAVAEAYGTTAEALIGQRHGEAHEPDDEVASMLADDRLVIDSGEPKFIDEEPFTSASGDRRLFRTIKIPFTESGTNAPAVLGVATDITQLRSLERLRTGEASVLQLIATESPLEDVLHQLVVLIEREYPDLCAAVLLLDETRTHLHAAAAPNLPAEYARAIDSVPVGPKSGSCGTAAFRGKPVVVVDIATSPLWESCRETALAHGLRSCWSEPILDLDGHVMGTVALYCSTARGPTEGEQLITERAARLARIAIEHRNVHDALRNEVRERNRTAERLQIREQEYRLLFENAPLGIATTDAEGRLVKVNQVFCQLLGYEAAQLQRMTFLDITHPEDLEKSMRLNVQMKKGHAPERHSMRKRYVCRDGSVVHAVVHMAHLAAEAEGGERFVAQVVDITKQMEAEEEARQHRERLAHVSRLSTMGEMAAGIAHEVNQPLTAIASYAQACARLLLDDRMSTEHLLETLQQISEEAVRAGQIIHRLRDLARKRESRRELCDINQLVRETAALARTDARLHGAALELDLADTLPTALVDAIQIQQVVLNLIRNAAEAVASGVGDRCAVTVRTGRLDGGLQVTVIDTGLGVPPQAAGRLFEPFFTTKTSGMGMGLSISRSLITSHGGRLWYTSNHERGTAFHFTLPTASTHE